MSASRLASRCLSLVLCVTIVAATSCHWKPIPTLEARIGHTRSSAPLLLFATPPAWAPDAPRTSFAPGGALVDMSDLTLRLPVEILSIDTILGTRREGSDYRVRGAYDSAAGRFVWAHEMHFDGSTFVDATGFAHDVSDLPDGAEVPGSGYVRASPTEMRTRGNRVYRFDAETGRLSRSYWRGTPSVYLHYEAITPDGRLRLDQCSPSLGCEEVLSFHYDPEGRLVGVVDRAGRSAELVYEEGRLVQLRDPQAIEEGWTGRRFEYDGAALGPALLRAVTTQEGERTEFDYQEGVRILRIRPIGEGNPVYGFFLHPSGREGVYATSVVNPKGASCTFEFDELRRLLAMRNALGESTRFEWSGFDVVSEVDPWGATTLRSRTPQGEVEVTPRGNVVVTSFDPSAENRRDPWSPAPRQVVDSLGSVAVYGYDSAGRRVLETQAGETLHYELDEEGRITSVQLASGRTLLLRDYVNGSPREVVHVGDPDDALPDTVEHYRYDLVGNPTESPEFHHPEQAGRPGIDVVGWDANRNRVRITSVETLGGHLLTGSIETRIVRRSDGRKAAILRPYGAPGSGTHFGYDALGRPTSRCEQVTERSGVTMTHCARTEYDLVGNPTLEEDAAGRRLEYEYDALNRAVILRRSGPGLVAHVLTQEFTAGRLLRRTDTAYGPGGASEDLFYDGAGDLVRIVYPAAGEIETRALDLRGRVVERSLELDPGGALPLPLVSLGFHYDESDRVTAMTRDGALLLEADFVGGQSEELRFGNGLTRRFHFDPWDRRLVGSVTTDSGGATVAETVLYRAGCAHPALYGCLNENTTTALGTTHQSFLVGPLASAPLELGEGMPGARATAYHVSAASLEDAIATPSLHHAGAVDDTWVDFDALGGLVARGPQLAPLVGTEYNLERNRLEATTLPSPSGGSQLHHEYFYDEAGYVVQRDDTPIAYNAQGRIAQLGDHFFHFDGLGRPIWSGRLGAEQTTLFGGAVIADAYGNPVAMDLGRVELGFGLDPENRYRHFDFRGNVKFVSDDSGEIVSHLRYTPWGPDATLGEASPRSFALGSPLGDEGLLLLGARVYDPAIHAFLSPDPIYQVTSQYAYAEGNPVHLWDGTGLLGVVPPGGALIAAGAVLIQAASVAAGMGLLPTAVILLSIGVFLVLLGVALNLLTATSGSEVTAPGALSAGGFGSCAPLGLRESVPPTFPPWAAWLAFVASLGACALARRRFAAASARR